MPFKSLPFLSSNNISFKPIFFLVALVLVVYLSILISDDTSKASFASIYSVYAMLSLVGCSLFS